CGDLGIAMAASHCGMYSGVPRVVPRSWRAVASAGMSSRCALLASDALAARAMGSRAWEACLVFCGRYSGVSDLAERRWHIHGSHQKRQVVRRVDSLESWHLAGQAVMRE